MTNTFETAIQIRNQGLSAKSESNSKPFLEEALILFQQAVNEKPDDAEYVFYLAMSLDILDLEQEAIPLYHRAIGLELPLDQQLEATLYLASSYFNIGHLDEAEKHLVKAECLLDKGAIDKHEAFYDIASKIRNRGVQTKIDVS
ncbi:tetratricopeptide repeat protein [Leptolyngbya sp. AN03gr2]|uniref:tetratricopeptide repeat protein n=1 Tax=unclassified Leptolyngbya TaxID=2650499 RepID=UPI003D321868